jgi:glycosyltransferase involved in cell wall biosynthesis
MKVLHVIPSVGPLRGGPSEIVRAMVFNLGRAGVCIEVATTDDNGAGRLHVACSEAIVDGGGTYRYFPRQTRFYTFSWPLTHWLARHVAEFDLVHIHALFSYAALPAAYWAKRNKVPYLVRPVGVLNRWGLSRRRPWMKKVSYALIEKHILNAAAAVHYSSEQERYEAEQLGTAPRSVVIHNPITMPRNPTDAARGLFRARYPQLAERFIILFLSRLDRKKGLDILLPAFAAVRARYPQVMLVVAGSGEHAFTARLQREAARLGIAADILWTGFLSGEEKWAALADADIFVLPSYSENFGVAVVEAMAAGLPVVVTDQIGIHREISDARAGIVVSCDPAPLAQGLAVLISDKNLRAELSQRASCLARTKFSPETATKSLIALYQEICKPAAQIIFPAAS